MQPNWAELAIFLNFATKWTIDIYLLRKEDILTVPKVHLKKDKYDG